MPPRNPRLTNNHTASFRGEKNKLGKNVVVFLNGERGLGVLPVLRKKFHTSTVVVLSGQRKLFAAVRKIHPRIHGNILVTHNVNSPSFLARLRRLKPQLHVVAGFPQIFRKPLLRVPKRGTINLHAGRLPQYRGGSPLNWQIINGEKEIGISTVLMDEGIDSGRVLATSRFRLAPQDTIREAHAKANALFPGILMRAIRKVLLKGARAGRSQNPRNAGYWHQRGDEDGEIVFQRMGAREVICKVRALTHPYPGAWALLKGKRIRIYAAQMPKLSHRGTPGRVLGNRNGQLLVGCRDFAVCLTDTEPSLRRPGVFYFDR